MAKMKTRRETRAYHERYAEDRFAAYELTDSDNFDHRQKARNILRYQMRGYCFDLPPVCARYGKHCFFCSHIKCRENEQYDGKKWNYDFDPDIDRFSLLFDNLKQLAKASPKERTSVEVIPPKVDTEHTLSSLLITIAEGSKNTVF
jgi:hypothetical protein